MDHGFEKKQFTNEIIEKAIEILRDKGLFLDGYHDGTASDPIGALSIAMNPDLAGIPFTDSIESEDCPSFEAWNTTICIVTNAYLGSMKAMEIILLCDNKEFNVNQAIRWLETLKR